MMIEKEIEEKIFGLPPVDRVCLAEKLLSSLDDGFQKELDTAWAQEVEDRISAYEQGKLTASDASEVFKRMEAEYIL